VFRYKCGVYYQYLLQTIKIFWKLRAEPLKIGFSIFKINPEKVETLYLQRLVSIPLLGFLYLSILLDFSILVIPTTEYQQDCLKCGSVTHISKVFTLGC